MLNQAHRAWRALMIFRVRDVSPTLHEPLP
jgi:hypothetical protein